MRHGEIHPTKTKGHRLFILLIGVLSVAVLVNWAWNGAGAALFNAPHAEFVDTAALIASFAGLLALARFILFRSNRAE